MGFLTVSDTGVEQRRGVLGREDAAALGSGALTFDLGEYWRLAVKYHLVIIGALVGALLIGAAVSFLTTPTYTSMATLKIDRETERVLDVEEVAPRESLASSEEFFQTQYGLLKSRSLAERVIDSLGLASSDDFIKAMGGTAPERGDRTAAEFLSLRRQQVISLVMANFGVSPIRGSRLVLITFESPDPALAARVTNAYAENFIQANLDRRFESSSYAREFLEEQIAQTKAKLEATERSLVEYADAQGIINLSEAGPTGAGQTQSLQGSNLSTLNAALAAATAQRIAAEQRWRQARSSPLTSLPEFLQNPAIQRLTEERARLDAQYQQNDRIYQGEWPAQSQLRGQIEELDNQITEIGRGILRSIEGQYIIAANNERALQGRVDGLKGEVQDLRGRSVDYNILMRELDTSRTLYDALLERYKEVGVTGAVASNNISIVDRAEVPRGPSKPNVTINILLAALLGLGLGVLAAFVLEALDETLATPEDAETKLGLPILGVIPLLARQETPAEALNNVRSPMSEAYYALQTALKFSTPNGLPTTILFTSSRPAEGKSTSSFATSLYLARIGKRVLLVDGDLRNPSMHRVVGVSNTVGMTNLLAGDSVLADAVQPTKEANLFMVSAGPLPPNPVELLGGDRLRSLLAEMQREFDHIIIDGPPVLGFGDAPLLASTVEGTLFVLESKGTRRAQARGAMRRLLVSDARLLGGILTKFNIKAAQYGGYDYAYDYNYVDGDTSSADKPPAA
ncbi:MAG: polysaccharide biosynthesis tyrosine autokinase [Alphaproteobacteria bacterium]|nr:polysaccharide biosynthesis tyrosine autokinase [Alphaproteobacteria bacterium]MBU1525469.1 polysaccharide biosynthesis tyrosine autokinase [Alphaproteobacteria bacterium]MBU2116319.1 polysaccharide biosynthesis tyrosine autokinase [Alphaproteobacteria bacterium]MBU2350871.1 polysaccharide biosynthesis tyrosine autokinase [Alphaproteobacteria bacterium]MBU2381748.1 polysaccharide biosynthesis tyrosine autokinase [Alphaproteobacteria bacterium]